ncbi:polymerase delta-interacting protein 3 isoform X2 [Lepisosteus oculatus]|uniref:polymerase delta-interacting protein 3 isoform X2 n=1 Tax=Lepisosteus oculatus TaxID=7918 RepID=UPI0035F511C2
MADLSLDELIRLRGLNGKGNARPVARGGVRSRIGPPVSASASVPPLLSRGAAGAGAGVFDARQKIGVTDARQRLGGASGTFPLKDAREKLTQKDARLRIRGAVQDAREMINSRKQQQQHGQPAAVRTAQIPPHQQGLNSRVGGAPAVGGVKKVVDARDRLSLKRSIAVATPTVGAAMPTVKITKTIQRPVGLTSGVRINMATRSVPGPQVLSGEEDEGPSIIPSKQMKITTTNDLAQMRPGASGSLFSLPGPLTKVVQNDTYTAPPSAPAAPLLTSGSQAAPLRTHALQAVSRTLVNHPQGGGTESTASTPPQPVFSPLEGTKMTVNNLHSRVTEEDIVELFCVCGALKRARLVKAGVAEVVFVKKEDAVSAYRKYNNRCLDGQPMKCTLHIQGNVITSDQPILLRLSDSPGVKKDTGPPELRRLGPRPPSSQPPPEVDPQTVLRALFKTSPAPPPDSTAQPTAFRIKI